MEMCGIRRWGDFYGDGWDVGDGVVLMSMGGMWEMGGFYGDGYFLWSWMDFM
jgi:hypothetical protein